jgi:SagB-type dehydrogenase family enzyme
MKKTIEDYRFFLKDTIRKEIDFSMTDQSRGKEPPPVQKKYDTNRRIEKLPPVAEFMHEFTVTLAESIKRRESVRIFSAEPLKLKELSFLLWATQGVRSVPGPGSTLRTVPSAGARHSFETYLYIRRVENLSEGIYRYLPLSHCLLFEFTEENIPDKLAGCCFGQMYAGNCAVAFIWSVIPYRMEWRYHLAAHKVTAIDAGHVCQNLYLACQAINAGTCAIGAYDQERFDKFLHLDGINEFVIYLAPVGKTG